MNKRLFIGVTFLIIAFTGVWALPRLRSKIYQIRAGQIIQMELWGGETAIPAPFACDRLNISDTSYERIEHAAGDLAIALRILPTNSQAAIWLGRAYCALGKPSQAIQAFSAFTKLKPENPLGHLELGFAYQSIARQQELDDGNQNERLELDIPMELVAENISPDITNAIREWRKALVEPGDFVAAGDQLLINGKPDEALRWYERALWMELDYAQAWVGVGQVLRQSVRDDRALQAFELAWQSDPLIGTTPYVDALVQLGDEAKAEELLRQALDQEGQAPTKLDWWRRLGKLLTDQERWEEASDVYDQAIADSPEQIDLWIAKGWAGYEMGAGFPDTYNVFQHAISLNERRADGYNAVGLLMIREKRYNEADPWFVQAIVRQPNRWSIYLDRARAKRLAGQLDDAMKVLQEAINIFPDQPALFSQMALVYQLLDQTEPAMRAIEKALSLLESPDVGYYLRAGEIYEWAGYADRARQAFEMVLQLQPGNQTAQKALDRLAQPEP